jgi:GTPase
VVDGKAGLSPIDQEIARLVRRSTKPSILVVNKIDHEKHDNLAVDFDSLGFDRSVSISAEHNRGTSELVEAIEQSLPPAANIERPTRLPKATARQAPNVQHPLAIAIVGRPNVGKSSLINSVVQQDRAIVSELAGTTRDAIDIWYERDGKQFVFIDTAGMRRRSKHSSSVEVFSVMRAERSIRRADFCVLMIDLLNGVTAQDKRIAGLIQNSLKPCVVVLNKWDLVKPKRNQKQTMTDLVAETRERLFFADYAPILVASALTHENVDRLFRLIEQVSGASRRHIGTGVLNRLLRAAFAANPPPMRKGKRLKLFYAAQAGAGESGQPRSPELVLFVNDPKLLTDHYQRYLVARIREKESYPGLPITLTAHARSEGRRSHSPGHR